ncbi:MAG: flagellar biosynthetic protein FliR [Thermodesulfobacteriota bacterium]
MIADLIFNWKNFLLVALRVGCLLFFWPVWDNKAVPVQIKVYAALVIALALTPVVSPHLPPLPTDWLGVVQLLLREFLLGMSIGLVFRFIFSGVQMAGDLAAIQMGFSAVSLFDPQSQSYSTVIADILLLIAVLIFLTMDVHHLLFRLLAESFSEVPVGGLPLLPGRLFNFLPALGKLMFQLAIKVVAPVLAVLFLTQLALGLVARAVPQIQVMIVSFPLTIALGLIFLSLTLILVGPFLAQEFTEVKVPLHQVMQAWQG